ncbi:hypothetical protein HDU76_005802 [Blyttiomyces sp. JEL0837]|nr:hypothetical protein HDU76_005802 [Blyttiomyces sp. JEL0837]
MASTTAAQHNPDFTSPKPTPSHNHQPTMPPQTPLDQLLLSSVEPYVLDFINVAKTEGLDDEEMAEAAQQFFHENFNPLSFLTSEGSTESLHDQNLLFAPLSNDTTMFDSSGLLKSTVNGGVPAHVQIPAFPPSAPFVTAHTSTTTTTTSTSSSIASTIDETNQILEELASILSWSPHASHLLRPVVAPPEIDLQSIMKNLNPFLPPSASTSTSTSVASETSSNVTSNININNNNINIHLQDSGSCANTVALDSLIRSLSIDSVNGTTIPTSNIASNSTSTPTVQFTRTPSIPRTTTSTTTNRSRTQPTQPPRSSRRVSYMSTIPTSTSIPSSNITSFYNSSSSFTRPPMTPESSVFGGDDGDLDDDYQDIIHTSGSSTSSTSRPSNYIEDTNSGFLISSRANHHNIIRTSSPETESTNGNSANAGSVYETYEEKDDPNDHETHVSILHRLLESSNLPNKLVSALQQFKLKYPDSAIFNRYDLANTTTLLNLIESDILSAIKLPAEIHLSTEDLKSLIYKDYFIEAMYKLSVATTSTATRKIFKEGKEMVEFKLRCLNVPERLVALVKGSVKVGVEEAVRCVVERYKLGGYDGVLRRYHIMISLLITI